ncbi:hypothetical protein K450DRAFT_231469 [Umbelopsis ramanniana AG]|uniref:Adhesin domain-containing protein n=1 Tax=Umbelopsis ramanniana AG TaxID=1314678 RepID=A0AAD5ECL7_UMBRA|nr:uncharacterized protein K450DRAFT_231469 [Umbelopsis ramanniana AG]KAI8581473.1 hypothetical protein K450DRAFT_231469 [Umbelopsis ramanniana AG]
MPLPPPVPYTPDRLRVRRQKRGCCATYCTWSCFVFLLFLVVLKLSVTFAPKCTYRSTYTSEKVSLKGVEDLSIDVSGIPSFGSWITFKTSNQPYFQTTILSPSDDANVRWTVKDGKAQLNIKVDDIVFTSCVAVQVTVSLPNNLQSLKINAIDTTVNFPDGPAYVKDIDVRVKNTRLVSKGNLSANRWYMRTTNARIEGTFSADTIDLGTSNAEINAIIQNATYVTLASSNGRISGSIDSRDTASLTTTNGGINLGMITAKYISLITSNSKIEVAKADVGNQLDASTSNARINLSVWKAGKDAVITSKTSNAPNSVSLVSRDAYLLCTVLYNQPYIPLIHCFFRQSNLYDAHFYLFTTHSETKVIAREGEVQYDLSSKTEKEGDKLTQGGSVGKVDVSLKTTNAACELSFR